MSDEPVEDNLGLYYDLGHGVNEAEAQRQDAIFKIASIRVNFPDGELSDELEDLFEIIEKLAELAGAKVFEEGQE